MRRVAPWLALLLTLLALVPPARAGRAIVPSSDDSLRPPVTRMVASPVAGRARDYLAEARASFTPANRRYQAWRVAFALCSPLVGVAAGLALLFTGLSRRFRDIAHARARGRWARVLVFFTLYSVTMFVLLLPLAFAEDYALEHAFGLSTQSLGAWGADQLKTLVVQVLAVGVLPLLALAWRTVEVSPRRWWLLLAVGTLPVATAIVLLQPLVFDPLFNKFTPLHDEALRRDILALGARAGVPARNVYEADMSARTNKINAYVSGFGASQRIVLWDTALKGLTRDEILFVMGHEMGHYVLRHVWTGLVWIAIGAFGAFWLTWWLTGLLLARFGPRWGIGPPGDLAAIPLVIAMLSFVSWLGTPVTNAISRGVEHDADVFALEITHDNDAGARSFLALARGNRSDPEPAAWVRLVLYSHPPLAERIRFALSYHPWSEGRPNRFYRER